MPQVSGFNAKLSATSPEEWWRSYHVLNLVYCVKNCSCVKMCMFLVIMQLICTRMYSPFKSVLSLICFNDLKIIFFFVHNSFLLLRLALFLIFLILSKNEPSVLIKLLLQKRVSYYFCQLSLLNISSSVDTANGSSGHAIRFLRCSLMTNEATIFMNFQEKFTFIC